MSRIKVLKRTFIAHMPDESGAFLKASRIIAGVGANIARVSYNKAVDAHMLFLDVSGTAQQLSDVQRGLERVGYTQTPLSGANVMLLEFKLCDISGAVTPLLELIHSFNFNITYMNSQENSGKYQYFKMGLLIEEPVMIKAFIDKAVLLCELRVVDYEPSEKPLDNTVFYLGFANKMREKLALGRNATTKLMMQSNLLMQLLDERGELPHKTFGYIGKFAEMLSAYRGESFKPRVSCYKLGERLPACGEPRPESQLVPCDEPPIKPNIVPSLHVIEPPCGSNIYIIDQGDNLLFIDSGFACFEQEMLVLLRALLPHFEQVDKELLLTHPDIDHSGLLHIFNRVHLTRLAYDNFVCEKCGEPNHRERNPMHAPYSCISAILSGYNPPSLETLLVIDEHVQGNQALTGDGVLPNTRAQAPAFAQTDGLDKTLVAHQSDTALPWLASLKFGNLNLDVYLGNGGHALGEAVFVCEQYKLVFSGDIVVNSDGFSPEQAQFNLLAPYLMTSVNMDSSKAATERKALLRQFNPELYTYCFGHGAIV